MKSKICMLSFIAIACASALAFAAKQDAADAKVGILNIQRLVVESKAGKEAKAAFEKELKGKQATLDAKEKEIKTLDEDLKSRGPSLKPQERKAKEEGLAQELKTLARLKQDLQEELRRIDTELTSELVKEIYAVAKSIGEEGKYSLIVQAGPQIVYSDKAADITEEVLKRYDRQYQKK